jgi:glycerophosphoryl diester phosphodiesterase
LLHRVAHRGYSAVAPENTLPALAAAVLAGATMIEFDVRTTADGVPVVIHDRTVDRTTGGAGNVWDLTVAQVRRLDAGSWFSPAFAGVAVPLLSEVLDLLAPAAPELLSPPSPEVSSPAAPRVLPPAAPELLLEIKPPATAGQMAAILAMVDDRGLLARTMVQSFDLDVLRLVGEAVPDVRRGLLRFGFDHDQVTVAKELGIVACNPMVDAVLAEPATVDRLAAAGVAVMPWTANDPALWPALADAGVAGLITDRAGALAGWAGAR